MALLCTKCLDCDWCVTDKSSIIPTNSCVYNGNNRNIESPYLIPSWCPSPNKNSMMTKKKFKDLPYWEKSKILESIPSRLKWEDIKSNTVYHVPPYLNESRKDILVIAHTPTYLTYRVLNSKISTIYTIYPSSILWHFMVPHFLRKIEVVQKTKI